MKCSLHGEAFTEYREAALYYGERARSLGEAFTAESRQPLSPSGLLHRREPPMSAAHGATYYGAFLMLFTPSLSRVSRVARSSS